MSPFQLNDPILCKFSLPSAEYKTSSGVAYETIFLKYFLLRGVWEWRRFYNIRKKNNTTHEIQQKHNRRETSTWDIQRTEETKKNIRNSFENNKQNKSQIIIITKASTQQVHTSPKSSDKWTID